MKTLLVFLALCCSVNLLAQSTRDTQAVKDVVAAFENDFNEGGFKNAINYTTEDWEHINPFGGMDKGRGAVLKTVRDVHQQFLKGVTMTTDSIAVRFVTNDVALADVVHKVSTFTTPDGVKHENEQHRKTYVLVRVKGKWLLTLDHNTIMR